MIRLLRSELLKARTTRTAFGLGLGLAVLVGGIAAIAASTISLPPEGAILVEPQHPLREAISSLGFVPLFALLFGVLASTAEFRHGTISPTLLAVPARERVVAAKLVSSALVGLALALSATVVALAVALPILSGRGFELEGGDAAKVVVGTLGGALLWGALGAGLGALVANQVAAIVGSLAWILIAEQILRGLIPHVARYLPFSALSAFLGLDHGGDLLSPAAGVAVTLAYVLAAGALGALRLRMRDVT